MEAKGYFSKTCSRTRTLTDLYRPLEVLRVDMYFSIVISGKSQYQVFGSHAEFLNDFICHVNDLHFLREIVQLTQKCVINISRWSRRRQDPLSLCLKRFGINSGVSLCVKAGNTTRIFLFMARKGNYVLSLLNNIELFKRYIVFLEAKAREKRLYRTKSRHTFNTSYKFRNTTNHHSVVDVTNKFKNKIGDITLSKSEYECICYLYHGYSNTKIAKLTNLSKRTVKHYIANIKGKFGLQYKSELIKLQING